MAASQKEISVSEFFAKNRHLLGFDNPRKAMLVTVKEAVDNALDACEEGAILPDIYVKVRALAETRFKITVRDNGPGIVKKQIEHIFGKLLYGSKFHRMKMSRGQQGIGISAAGMYGLMTTGKPVLIISKVKRRKAHELVLKMDTSKNRAEIVSEVLLGPVIYEIEYDEAADAGVIAQLKVVMLDLRRDRFSWVVSNDYSTRVARKRHGYWRNKVRNQLLAQAAEDAETGTGRHAGLPPGHQREHRPPPRASGEGRAQLPGHRPPQDDLALRRRRHRPDRRRAQGLAVRTEVTRVPQRWHHRRETLSVRCMHLLGCLVAHVSLE